MLDEMRWLLTRLLGWRFVVLIDRDGKRCVRKARLHLGQWVAERQGGLIGRGLRRVRLLDDGEIENGLYVFGWEPWDYPTSVQNFPAYTKEPTA